MLRSLLTVQRRAFTCLFVPSAEQVVTIPKQYIATSSILRFLDKDEPHKKALLTKKTREEEMINFVEDADMEKEDMRPGKLFPNLETHSMMIGGVRYDELPIIHIKATHNNTILSLSKYTGMSIVRTQGSVGFRNARRGTNIAAQAAAVELGQKSLKLGYDTVRVCVKGIGPGRLAAVKGLQMAGMTIVSLTDTTPIPHNGNRPRKQRRL
ncbi:hypothetical protein ScPMuIL_018820 [Solemya velum]